MGPDLAHEDVLCVQCSYNLRGLDEGARCPECGTTVFRSLQGNLLVFSSDAYLASLHRGVTLILAAIAAQVVLTIAAIGGAVSMGMGTLPANLDLFELIATIVDLGLAAMIVWGWWLFSAPDPAAVGEDTGLTARRVIRATVIAAAALKILELIATVLDYSGPAGLSTVLTLVIPGVAALAFAALVVKFFAAMQYLRWIAPRLPDPRVEQRAKTLMWLGPLLCVVGALCMMIGVIVALVLYWNMLNWVRLDIKGIRADATRGAMA